MKEILVNLGINSYKVKIEGGLLDKVGTLLEKRNCKVFIVTDSNVGPLYVDRLIESLCDNGYDSYVYTIKAGEESKNYSSLLPMYEKMLEFGLTRTDIVIALGGGVTGDLTGFAAATYLRGVDFVQIPTSLLAQVDSSVGGKVAVDLKEGKNLIGNFYQPKAVFIDVDLLKTLPHKFYVDGLGEVVKYGCILDEELFVMLERIKDFNDFLLKSENIIARCVELKARVVEQDEKDKGIRMLLNFGHTYGHALEKFYDYKFVTHGEAVALGMLVITNISENKGQTHPGTTKRLYNLLLKLGFHIDIEVSNNELIKYMINDKKNLNNKLNLILIHEIGSSFIYQSTPEYFIK